MSILLIKHADIIGIESPKNLEWFIHKYKVSADLELLYNWAEDKIRTSHDNNIERNWVLKIK